VAAGAHRGAHEAPGCNQRLCVRTAATPGEPNDE
jgi:hypothetical protein